MRYLALTLFQEFLRKISEVYEVFIPFKEENLIRWKRWQEGEEPFLSYRASQSVKKFFFTIREKVGDFRAPVEPESRPVALVGLKACDLRALQSLDTVFIEGEFEDPFYRERRKNALVITIDCTEPCNYCFCNLLGGKPYALEGFDVNLGFIGDGFIVTTGSEKGNELISSLSHLLKDAEPSQLKELEKRRTGAEARLAEINSKYSRINFNETVEALRQKDDFWIRESFRCVECGACVFACPTCRCFILYDSAQLERVRLWDGCELPMFARVAGGINPRAYKFQRFQNRYFCKLSDYNKLYSRPGCVGCGRCAAVCPGGIDMRSVLMRGGTLAGEKSLSTS